MRTSEPGSVNINKRNNNKDHTKYCLQLFVALTLFIPGDIVRKNWQYLKGIGIKNFSACSSYFLLRNGNYSFTLIPLKGKEQVDLTEFNRILKFSKQNIEDMRWCKISQLFVYLSEGQNQVNCFLSGYKSSRFHEIFHNLKQLEKKYRLIPVKILL